MTKYKSLVTPNLNFRALAGNCLAMAQGIVGAPIMHPSATVAANNTKLRHHTRVMPNAVCVLWFDHWGRYGLPGQEVYANWGHVVVYVPGKGFASSSPVPGEVSTPYFYQSIEAVERAFAGKFRFWSEDINGKRVCEPVTTPAVVGTKGKKKLLMAYFKDAAGPGQERWAVFGSGFWLELKTQKAASAFAKQLGVVAYKTDQGGWDKFKLVSGG